MSTRKLQSVAVAISLDDGRLAIMRFITVGRGPGLVYGSRWIDPADDWWTREATDENVFQEIERTNFHGAKMVSYRILSGAEALAPALGPAPEDRAFRDALRDTDAAVEHDIEKARAVHLRHVREARTPKLAELDQAMARAFGRRLVAEAEGNEKLAADHTAYMLECEKQKQTLRDLPTTLGVESASRIDELKALWPAELPPPKRFKGIFRARAKVVGDR